LAGTAVGVADFTMTRNARSILSTSSVLKMYHTTVQDYLRKTYTYGYLPSTVKSTHIG